MGIIQKQALHSTIYTYIGILVGFCNQMFLMPNLISSEQIGFLSLINSLTNTFATIFCLGLPLIIVRLFPQITGTGKDMENGFSSFIFYTLCGGILLGGLVFALSQDLLITDEITTDFLYFMIVAFYVLFILRVFQKVYDVNIRMMYNTVLGSFSENLLMKIFITISLVLYWYLEDIDFLSFACLYLLALAVPGVVNFLYILTKGQISMRLQSLQVVVKKYKKDLAWFSVYGMLGSTGAIIMFEVDKLMVSKMIDLSNTGIYTIAFYFGVFINVPSKAIKRVAAVVVADAWKDNNVQTIATIYHKSCVNQFLIGTYLLLGIWLNVDYLFEFIPSEYAQGKYVILFVGLAQLIDMLTGVNNEIIASSRLYKFNTYFTGSMIVIVIILNYLLIPIYGLNGAALASTLTMVIINLMRFGLLYKSFGFQPFDRKFIYVSVFSILILFLVPLIPTWHNPVFDILQTGTILSVLYWGFSYYFKVSEDINLFIEKMVKNLFKK